MGFETFEHLLTVQGAVAIRVDGVENLLQLLLLVLVGEMTGNKNQGGLL
jgi:hypothetical protein